jgi:hypothetical protein
MVTWNEAKGKTKNDNQTRREIERIDLKGDIKIRLVGPVMPRYVYWIVTKDSKKMPVECLSFNRETESFDGSSDPFKEIDPEVYADKPQFAYVCNVIDRKDKKVKLLDLRATIYGQIADYAKNPEYGNPADELTGYDISIKREKTGPLPQNVKYSIIPARSSTPLSKEDKELELYELDKIFKRQTYDEQKKWLLENTTLFAGSVGDETKPEGIDDLA